MQHKIVLNALADKYSTLCSEYSQVIAMIASRQAGAPNELFRIHTDHLGTPMWVTDGTAAARVWDPIFEPFGTIYQEGPPPIEGTIESFESDLDILFNLSSTEAQQAIDITMPLRFAGQYFDTETQLHYNYFRDYDPSIGRYIQTDPIGLAGGVNTYGGLPYS